MRQETNRERVIQFMECLGDAARGPGRVYFTGGASAVLMGWRDMTVDIDLKADPEALGFFEAIGSIKESLDINLELACPSDFIPELPGWRERCRFIARKGGVDFLHYDFYSQALAKIERDHERDRHDVARMIEDGLIDLERLHALFEEIRPMLKRHPAIDEASFGNRVLEVTGRSA